MSTNNTIENDEVRAGVRERYGNIAQTRGRCGCGPSSCDSETTEDKATAKAERLGYDEQDQADMPEGANLGLGCGNPTAIAALKPGETVLDLGSGGGIDCFIAAKQVGPTGRVIGVDMTPDMISNARRNAQKGDYAHVDFRLGEIEALPVADGIVDVIMSNCVINLSPDKPAVFRESHRVLKPGGRLSIADIVATQPIPEDLRRDFAAFTSCVSGAALVEDLETMIKDAGFSEVQITLKEKSRSMINGWSESGKAGQYVVSALIEAVK